MTNLTIVSMEVVTIQLSGKMLAEMSDNTLVELSFPWGLPNDYSNFGDRPCDYRYLTEKQMREKAQNYNSNSRHGCNAALHSDKVRRLGWDYASRGY
jgi:hypothetical protein